MNFQRSYDDLDDVIVVVCSINYLIFFSKGRNRPKFAPTLLQTTVIVKRLRRIIPLKRCLTAELDD